MSKCNSISWMEITGIGNLDVIHIGAIEACVWDFESLVSFAVFLCEDSCMKSRYHYFILVRIQEYIWRWRISTNYGYFFVDSENKDEHNYGTHGLGKTFLWLLLTFAHAMRIIIPKPRLAGIHVIQKKTMPQGNSVELPGPEKDIQLMHTNNSLGMQISECLPMSHKLLRLSITSKLCLMNGLCFAAISHLSRPQETEVNFNGIKKSRLWVVMVDFDPFCLFHVFKVRWLSS